jgi:TRAP-type C4-dicarboxylate transport system permease small subunit
MPLLNKDKTMTVVKKISKVLEYWELVLTGAGCVCAFAIMCLITYDVASRNLFGFSNNGLTEMVKLLLLAVFTGSLPYVQRTKSHVILEFTTDKAPPLVKRLLDMAATLLGLFLFSSIVNIAFVNFFDALKRNDKTSGLVNFPVWPTRLFLALVIATMIVRLILDFIMDFSKLLSGKKEEPPNE